MSLVDNRFNCLSSQFPQDRLVADLNGLSQYIDLGDVSFPADFGFQVSFYTTKAGTLPLLGSDNEAQYLVQLRDAQIRLYYAQGASNAAFSTGAINIKDGMKHTLIIDVLAGVATVKLDGVTLGSSAVIPYLGVNNWFVGRSITPFAYFDGVAFDYSDSLGRTYPINDGWANNPVIKNTADPSGITDGTAINFTEATWIEVPL